MTAQKLTASTSTDSHKAFRQALQLKSNSEQPYGRETGPMPIPQQQPKQDAIQAERPQASWGVANSVEPDAEEEKAREQSQLQLQQRQHQPKRHPHLTVVTDTDAATAMPPTTDADAGGGGGAAIPMSPPSSPTHVVAAHSQDQLVVAAPAPNATTKSVDTDLPPVVAPSPTSTAPPQQVTVADDAASPPAEAAPAAPIRLGRGRKLCPNCKALTKSAVKQCRECGHIFNPVSQRLRAQHREPKENEEVPILPRRRHRPSQRLLESLVEPEEPSSSHAATTTAAAAGESDGGQAPSALTRRPLGSASNSGGDGNQRVVSTPPAGGGGSKEQQLPKRSHKRKNPLPPGVAPPKRKKGAAAAARLAAAAQATSVADPTASSTTVTRGILPILTLPEQQRVAQDLLASPTPSRHTVPESPELAPMGSPAGPLLFMGSSASNLSPSGPLEDDSEWLSRGGSIGVGGCVGSGASGSVSPTIAFVEQQLQQQQQQQLFAAGAATSLPGLLLDGTDDEDEVEQQQQQQQQHVLSVRRPDGGGIINPDISAEGQDRDPFADVEMWWEGGGVAAVVNPAATATAGVPPTFPMVGRDGTMQQRVVFPQNMSTNTELLGDTEDALIWNPLRAPSSSETGGAANTGGPVAAATGTGTTAAAAGRTLTLWPGSSNNDNQLLLSSASTASSSSAAASSFRSNGSPSPESVVYPNFERGAAIASAVGGSGSSNSSNAPGSHGHGRAEFLLAEASCSSLPEPLVFGGGNGSGTPVAAAVSADSSGDGESGEAGGFWNPLFPAGRPGSS